MSSRPSFSLGRALSAAFTGLPAMFGSAWAILILWWAVIVLVPQARTIGVPAIVTGPVCALLMVIGQYVTCGALYRIALFGRDARKEGLGIGGLQIGWPELRLVLADMIVTLFMLLMLVAVVLVFAIAFNMAGMAEGQGNTFEALQAMFMRHNGKDWIFIGYLIAAWVFLIFVSLKFVLLGAANVAQRRLVTLNALGLSSGNVGKLFIGFVLLIAPFTLFALAAIIGLANGRIYSYTIVHYVLLTVMVFLLLPLMIGFLSSAYRQIVASRTT